VLPFLHRSHFLNRSLGVWRHRALKLIEGHTGPAVAETVR
jgi:hypothetical protein